MKNIYRWIFEHSGLCRALLFLLLATFTFYAATFEYVSFLSIYLLDLAVWFLVGRFIAMAPAKLLQGPHAQLHQNCDPYPLLEETQHLLERNFDGMYRQLIEIDHAVALRETGDYEKTAEILENINIDKFPGTTPYMKYIYYHNLCDILYLLNRAEEARVWARKFRQIYRDLPPIKSNQDLSATHDLMEAEILHYEGNHEDALRKVAWIKLPNPCMVMGAAMLAARCHLALDEPEKAREKLQYVIDNGNRLYLVEKAKQLLETLS